MPTPCHFTRLAVDPASGVLLASDCTSNHLCYALHKQHLVVCGGVDAALQSTAVLPLPSGCMIASPSGQLTVRTLKQSAMHKGTSSCHLAPCCSLDLGATTLHLAPVFTALAAQQPLQRGAAGLLQATGAPVLRANSRGVQLPGSSPAPAPGPGQQAQRAFYQLPAGTPGCVAATTLGGVAALQPLGHHELTWLAPLQWVLQHLLVTAPIGQPMVVRPSGQALQLERFLDLDLLLQYTSLPLLHQLMVAELVGRLVTLEEVGRPRAGPLPAQEVRRMQREWLGARAAQWGAEEAIATAVQAPALRLHLVLLMVLDAAVQRCAL